jgi:transcriptional regulator with XRE-family HTH domain
MKANEWITRAAEVAGTTSDYGLAKRLGITRQGVSSYRRGKTLMDDDTCIVVAEILEIDPIKIIADQNAERAKTDRARAFWKRIGAAAAVILAAAVGGLTPRTTMACGASGEATDYTLCALDKRRRRDKRTTANSEAHHTRRRAIPRRQRKNRAPIPAH